MDNNKELKQEIMLFALLGITAWSFYTLGKTRGITTTVNYFQYQASLEPAKSVAKIIQEALS